MGEQDVPVEVRTADNIGAGESTDHTVVVRNYTAVSVKVQLTSAADTAALVFSNGGQDWTAEVRAEPIKSGIPGTGSKGERLAHVQPRPCHGDTSHDIELTGNWHSPPPGPARKLDSHTLQIICRP
jgi:hypothetical protein